jgi:ATP-dependent RNA helicase DDX27
LHGTTALPNMAIDDFVMTLDSDVEEEEAIPRPVGKKGKSNAPDAEDALLNPEFSFDLSGDPYVDLLTGSSEAADLVKSGSKPVRTSFSTVTVLS